MTILTATALQSAAPPTTPCINGFHIERREVEIVNRNATGSWCSNARVRITLPRVKWMERDAGMLADVGSAA